MVYTGFEYEKNQMYIDGPSGTPIVDKAYIEGRDNVFLRNYRRKIAEEVEDKMNCLGTCPNEKDIILSIIAPEDYNRKGLLHCGTDCWNDQCKQYCVKPVDITRKE